MGALLRSLAGVVVISLGSSAAAWATDRVIDGQRLVLKQVGAGTKLIFVSRDPNFLFPAIGGADDPATVGATIELFSQSEGQGSLTAPPGAGNPGWTSAPTPTANHRFRNGEAPGGISAVRVAVLREGKILKIVAKSAGLPLAVSQGAVGIRITTGTLRSCTRFTGSSIRKDVAGAFVGSNSSGGLPSCSDGSMNGAPECGEGSGYPFCGGACPGDDMCVLGTGVCQCVPPSTPCGETGPVCGGTCPAGEQCVGVGPGLFPNCVCLPVGSTPCGSPGPPVCGGACPSGTACRPLLTTVTVGGTEVGCSCAAPGPCGQGGLDCGNGFLCAIVPPSPSCLPIACGGDPTYPTCGGTCVSGAACQALKIDAGGGIELCVCAVPAACDSACGGYTCPSGEVCIAQNEPSLSCSCGAP